MRPSTEGGRLISDLGSFREKLISTEGKTESWLVEPLQKRVASAIKKLEKTEDVQRIAVMPDVHLAKGVCVGCVVATSHLIFPEAVGSDIGCGMAAIQFDLDAAVLDEQSRAEALLRELSLRIPPIRHARARAPAALPNDLQEWELSSPKLESKKGNDARLQFGTLGRGNHFIEFQSDDANQLWLMVHSGSRGIGQAIANHHIAKAAKSRTGLACIDQDSTEGASYLNDHDWALRYAHLSRSSMIQAAAACVAQVFGGGASLVPESLISCHHNHVAREVHAGKMLLVHRKGAMNAAPGALGVIPGSMGTKSYHVEGRSSPRALNSCSHGAGRAMSRTEAHEQVSLKDLRRQMRGVWYLEANAERLVDEAPAAYKNISKVMRAQKELVKVIRELRPQLSYKGS